MTNRTHLFFLLMAASIGTAIASPAVVLARAAVSPSPAPAACAEPTVYPVTLKAVEPEIPALAIHYGIGGVVNTVVSLDAESHVVGVRIQNSSNPIFDAPSLAAARAGRYRTMVRDCVPVAGEFVFSVEYEIPTHPSLASDALRYLPGTWVCRDSATGISRPDRFTLTATGLVEEDAQAVRTIARDRFAAWTVSEGGRNIGYALPWVDPDWIWSYRVRMADGIAREEYERIDDATFKRIRYYETERGVVTKTERCSRS